MGSKLERKSIERILHRSVKKFQDKYWTVCSAWNLFNTGTLQHYKKYTFTSTIKNLKAFMLHHLSNLNLK